MGAGVTFSSVVVEAASWFQCDDPRNEGQDRFLKRLRVESDAWSSFGIVPGDTFANATWMAPLFLQVALPGLSHSNLQVGYWQDPPLGHGLEGMWSDGSYLLDDERHDQDGLTVLGLEGEPEEFATWTARWFTQQFWRPVERLDWLSRGEVIASSWRLADTGLVVARRGAFFRTLKRAPTTVTTVREGGRVVAVDGRG